MNNLFRAATAILLAVPSGVTSQTVQREPPNIKDFELICYCSSRVATPHFVVGLDNNGQILSAARSPISKQELASRGIAVNDSQLRLLRDWGLLGKFGDKYVAKMGIFGPVEMARLRSRLAPLVTKAVADNGGHLEAISAELRRREHSDAAHTVAFSYILDGLLWEELGKMGKMGDLEPDIDHPFWNGTFWAVFPKPASAPGTNSTTKAGAELQMMWKKETADLYQPLDDQAVEAWLKSLGSAAGWTAIQSPPAGSPVGKALLIDERTNDALYVEGVAMARSVAETLASQDFSDVMPTQSPSDRVIIAAHEFIWRALDEISKRPEFAEPSLLTNAQAKLSDIAPLLIVSIKKQDDSSSPH